MSFPNTSARAHYFGTASIAALGFALTLAATGAAHAQAAAAEDTGDAIVVTGIRASLDSAAKLKKATPTIVESVSAEDIGKLPDVSIADSLARLPGVTARLVIEALGR